MDDRKPRKDAARNRVAVIEAADALFARCERPAEVTMADIAAEAGVGKGTLFRAFGDRTGLIRALFAARIEPVRVAVESGPPPLGPDTPPSQRIPALLDAIVWFKLDNRHLSLALEGTGDESPYQAEHYEQWHLLLQETLERIPGLTDCSFTAHALLAATRADLVEHLVEHDGTPNEEIRAQLARFTAKILGEART